MRKLTGRQAQDAVLAAVFVSSLAAIAVGIAMVYVPAGVIGGGVGALVSTVLYERGRSGRGR